MLTQEEYNAKREARYERLLKAAKKAENESNQLLDTARKMSDIIPFGQPILIDHYSAKRDINYRSKIQSKYRRGFELMERAQQLKSRAENTANNTAIYSDDPSALNQLSDKLADLKAKQEMMKATNKAIRKNDRNTLESLGHPKSLIDQWLDPAPMPWPGKGYASFELTNLNARIKAAEKRAAIVEKKQETPDKDETIGEIRVEWRPGENRIRVYFPARVPLDVFKELKSHGFRVLRSEGEGAFSAFYNFHAGQFIQKLRNNQS